MFALILVPTQGPASDHARGHAGPVHLRQGGAPSFHCVCQTDPCPQRVISSSYDIIRTQNMNVSEPMGCCLFDISPEVRGPRAAAGVPATARSLSPQSPHLFLGGWSSEPRVGLQVTPHGPSLLQHNEGCFFFFHFFIGGRGHIIST